MAYVTEQEMIDRFGEDTLRQLADRDGDGGIDAAVLQATIDDATALIDGYLLTRHALPLPTVPDLLRQVAAKIAFRQLHVHGAPDEVEAMAREAERTLSRIAKGEIVLDVDGGGAPAGGAESPPAFEGAERLFSRDKLGGF